MIDAKALLVDLQAQQRKLERDLREQAQDHPALKDLLGSDYEAAKRMERTAETFGTWRDEQVTQAAVAWLLGCVFLRFCEDNRLVASPLLAGPGDGNRHAREHARDYFRAHPTDHERHYLEHCFGQLAQFPAVAGLYDRKRNPLYRLPVSYDAAKALVEFWQRVNPDTGDLIHDFTDETLNTRFLGDLYQDLSASARKRYALLQTPEFVEEFILERTLQPAIQTFGIDSIRMIDPTCGSGHFLLGGFHRLLAHWETAAPGLDIREHVKRAMGAVYGVDINPFAVAIARFRLLVAALKATGIRTLKEAPAWGINLTAGDSLLHGPRLNELNLGPEVLARRFQHAYAAENLVEIERILEQRYHVVIGNPPYITVKDRALNQLYRSRYRTCHRKYALVVPFVERFFQLALNSPSDQSQAGFVGILAANSFMKREFGKKLIEEFLPTVDLTHIIDTSGAYIPGHGTPTAILLGRARPPISQSIRAVLGKTGEPSTPDEPARGVVWSAITEGVDHTGSENEWISVVDIPRTIVAKHPWSTSGGGATELREVISSSAEKCLNDYSTSIGFGAILGEDEAFLMPLQSLRATRFPEQSRTLIKGEQVRDWIVRPYYAAVFPYDEKIHFSVSASIERYLWPWRSVLLARVTFGGQSYREASRAYSEYHQIPVERNQNSLAICFSEVATHNHFVFTRERLLFDKTAPIIKLISGSTEDDHLDLLGLLNSSVACFWLKQVCHNKGSTVDSRGARQTTDPFENFFQFNSTKVGMFPVPDEKPRELARALARLGPEHESHLPQYLFDLCQVTRTSLDKHRADATRLSRRMIAIQEELDWHCYKLFGLIDEDLFIREPPEVSLGQRAFEIVMARRVAGGGLRTTWFERHSSTPTTEIPDHWPDDYRKLVRRRIALIETHPWMGLLEQPENKRRWNQPAWEKLEEAALSDWLTCRLETVEFWREPVLRSVNEIAAISERDDDFMSIARLYTRQAGFNVHSLVGELLENSAVPALRAQRYKEAGLRKRTEWETTWAQQRREDEIDAEALASLERQENELDEAWRLRVLKLQSQQKQIKVGAVPVPPKYRGADFRSPIFWRFRGPLDVPKERFFSLPSGDAGFGQFYGWAGWTPVERVRAIFGTYTEASTRKGWEIAQLLPLLAAIDEELPWVLQWHNDVSLEFGVRLGDFFREQLGQELQRHGLTREDLANWKPAAPGRGRRRRAQA